MLMEINQDGEIKKYHGELIMIVSLKDFDDEEAKRPKSRTLSNPPGDYVDGYLRQRTSK